MNFHQRRFLVNASSINGCFNAVLTETHALSLIHNFWTADEIRDAGRLLEEWDVPANLVPFYGDWHELLALRSDTGEIVLLDDERRVIHTWHSCDAFTSQLTYIDDPPMDTSGVIDSWFDF